MIGTRYACYITDKGGMLIILALIVKMIWNKEINLMVQSDSTGNDRILQKMDFQF